ncbi:hypothetical protein SDC9_135179 [bioreactor metagenome]|uniref:Uncharacterized protein n=1 Tax=bioreactor metagenome TaxID=1076179 RepID=A0A645DGB1_9ZZZZ
MHVLAVLAAGGFVQLAPGLSHNLFEYHGFAVLVVNMVYKVYISVNAFLDGVEVFHYEFGILRIKVFIFQIGGHLILGQIIVGPVRDCFLGHIITSFYSSNRIKGYRGDTL